MAVKHFCEMLKMQPDLKQVYLQLGICYRNLSLVDEYLENFYKLMEFKDSFSEEELFELKLGKLKFLVTNNRLEEAMPLAYELDYTHPDNPDGGSLAHTAAYQDRWRTCGRELPEGSSAPG